MIKASKSYKSIFRNFISNRGSTLLEALIALSVIVVVLAATSVLVITSLNNTAFSRTQNEAGQYAQEGLEYIRSQLKDYDIFEEYKNLTSVQCMGELEGSVYPFTPGPCSSASVANYKREVLFELSQDCIAPTPVGGGVASEGLKVTVTVYFQSGKCPLAGSPADNTFCHKQEVTSCFLVPSGGSAVEI